MRSLSCLLVAQLLACSFAFTVGPRQVQGPRGLKVSSVSADSYRSYESQQRTSKNAVAVDWDWESVAQGAFETDKRPIILFDGQCNLCNGGVNFALDHDAKGAFRFVSLQSKVGRSLLLRSGRNANDHSSIVVALPDGNAHVESDAVMKIAQGLDGPMLPLFGKVGILFPRAVRDHLYKIVSENRYRFGEPDQCRLDFDGEFDNRFVPEPEEW